MNDCSLLDITVVSGPVVTVIVPVFVCAEAELFKPTKIVAETRNATAIITDAILVNLRDGTAIIGR